MSHLKDQLSYLESRNDSATYETLQLILEDEENHRDTGRIEGASALLYGPFRWMISLFTARVIRFGMRQKQGYPKTARLKHTCSCIHTPPREPIHGGKA
ncbi:demethoxyubiquinone hydroxylase family protein [Pseudomonas frederiksbergensis]|uniref:demethoxyubiquinone hydroxylase family protein n=1 Tax=Pseudomonas frederiksbergensis TaxID=104087 RepID=UPI00101ADB43|nr:demethoxyubiquinone hydroxylase family protein [Pseudomonas frederiksbergensis]